MERIDPYNNRNAAINKRQYSDRDYYQPSNNRSNDSYYSKKNQFDLYDSYASQDHRDVIPPHLSRQPRQDHGKLERGNSERLISTGKFLPNDTLNNNDRDYSPINPHYDYDDNNHPYRRGQTRIYQQQTMPIDYNNRSDLRYISGDKNLNNTGYNSYNQQYSQDINIAK